MELPVLLWGLLGRGIPLSGTVNPEHLFPLGETPNDFQAPIPGREFQVLLGPGYAFLPGFGFWREPPSGIEKSAGPGQEFPPQEQDCSVWEREAFSLSGKGIPSQETAQEIAQETAQEIAQEIAQETAQEIS
jgi:hypothetical protein